MRQSRAAPAIALLLSVIMIPGLCSGQGVSGTAPETNLEVMRALATRISAQAVEGLQEGKTISVAVLPRENAWHLEAALRHGLRVGGLRPVATDSADYRAEFGMAALRVEYENIRRDGFLGTRMVDRRVTVVLSSRIQHASGGLILLRDLAADSVAPLALGRIDMVENPNLPFTKGQLPAEGFFSNIAEPLIFVGAIGVAVFLLFHVRS